MDKLHQLMMNHPTIMDLSMLGCGKTYTSSALAMRLAQEDGICKKGILVICNVSVMGKWLSMKEQYGVPVLDVLSYAGMRSRKGKKDMKHGYLTRHDYRVQMKQKNGEYKFEDQVRFEATEKLREWAREGILVVMDEVQNIKNAGSDQNSAAVKILECVRKFSTSRALLMSGSPIDKEEQALAMVTALGLMGNETSLCTFNVGTKTYDFSGFERIKKWCALQPKFAKRLEKSQSLRAAFNGGKNAKTCMECLYVLFQKWIKVCLSAAMVGEHRLNDEQLLKFNGMYKLEDRKKLGELAAVVGDLALAVRFNPQTNTLGPQTNRNMGQITNALTAIERIKTDTFVRLAMEALVANKNRKVVVCVNYLETVEKLKSELRTFNPLVMTGACTIQQREQVIRQFQEPNSKHRLLIGNLTVLSTGIDLDDKHGGWERVCFVSPMFSTITLYQLGHRFKRLDTHTTARARLYMVYIKEVIEMNIMNALIRKGAIMKETVKAQAEAGVVFPCDYPEYDELE